MDDQILRAPGRNCHRFARHGRWLNRTVVRDRKPGPSQRSDWWCRRWSQEGVNRHVWSGFVARSSWQSACDDGWMGLHVCASRTRTAYDGFKCSLYIPCSSLIDHHFPSHASGTRGILWGRAIAANQGCAQKTDEEFDGYKYNNSTVVRSVYKGRG